MVSVIMSAFNSEQTIKKAIESVINQNYENFELIIVNDCSTDNTKNIIEKYKLIDNRIKLINHNVNKGSGLARRTGIQHSAGEYTMFLDSDDFIELDYIQTLYDAAIQNKADVVASGSNWEDENGKTIKQYSYPKIIIPKDNKDLADKLKIKYFLNSMMIKRSLWDNIEYSDKRFLEDLPTLFKIIYNAENILLLDYIGYHYYQNPNSLLHKSSSLKYLIYHVLSTKDIATFLRCKNDFKGYLKFLNEYKKLLNMSFEEEEVLKYKDELDELYEFYLLIKKQTCLENT